MRKNVGGTERIARLLLGAGLLFLGRRLRRGRGSGGVKRLLGGGVAALGLQVLNTAATQRCPANAALGRNTYEQAPSGPVDRVRRAVGAGPA